MNGNSELTIKDLFEKYGRRFASVLKNSDGINTVMIYEIVTVKGELPIVKIKTIDFNPAKKELLISNDDDEEDWVEAFELSTLVDNDTILPLSMLSNNADEKTRISSQKIRELGAKIFEYEKASKNLEVFTKKYETLRDEVIEAFISAADTILK
jgi:hypothetical protein